MKSYHDIAGDGGSDVLGQVAARQRAVADALAGVRRILAVGSGKGGVGKSTVTLALARAFRRRGLRIAILDADLNGPSQARMAGLESAPWIPADGQLALPRRPDGIGVVSLGSLLAAGQAAEAAERLAFVMVTVPSDVSRGVVARALAALAETPAALLGYVENMAGYLCRDCGEVRPLFPEPTVALDAPCLGRIPFDPALAELCDRGWPEGSAVEEDSAAFRQIEDLAAAIQDRLKRPSSVSAGVGGGPNQEPLEEETR